MKRYIVEFQTSLLAEVEYFVCEGDDPQHAQEQCDNAYPGAAINAIFVEVE